MIMSSQTGFSHTSGWALILPTNSNGNYQAVSGVFYRYLPDLPIARVIFLTGIAVRRWACSACPPKRRAAAAAGRGGGHAGRAGAVRDRGRAGLYCPASAPMAWSSRALHDAANDRPISFTPVCGRAAGVPVCLNPAYGRYLDDVTAALQPVLGEVAGLPGAPARVSQVAGAYTGGEGEAIPGDDDQRPPSRCSACRSTRSARCRARSASPVPRDHGAVRRRAAGDVRARVRGCGPRPQARRRSRRCRRRCCRAPGCRSPRSPRLARGPAPDHGPRPAPAPAARAGLRRGPAAGRTAARRPARLAGRSPGRAAVRAAGPGAGAVTAAGVHQPPPGPSRSRPQPRPGHRRACA